MYSRTMNLCWIALVVLLIGLGLLLNTLLPPVETPAPPVATPSAPSPAVHYGPGTTPIPLQMEACALEARIPQGRGHTMTEQESKAFLACVDRRIQAGEIHPTR